MLLDPLPSPPYMTPLPKHFLFPHQPLASVLLAASRASSIFPPWLVS